MRIAVTTETEGHETRVAATPETVKKLAGIGATVVVQSGAGTASGITDADYEAAGATIAKDAKAALSDADVVLKVRRPTTTEIGQIAQGRHRARHHGSLWRRRGAEGDGGRGLSSFAMELMPRITRAQVMDVLSSQANLAGYRAVIDAAAEFGRGLR